MSKQQPDFYAIIPARYHSTRLPGKLLLDIAGKPMLQHVYERAVASGAKQVVIATDDEQIRAVATDFGAEVCMTAIGHHSGTDRIAEAITKLGYAEQDIIVNIQGDEPAIPIQNIRQVAANLVQHTDAAMATLYEEIDDVESVNDPNIVKVVFDKDNFALYFSRAPIAWSSIAWNGALASKAIAKHYRHIGIYAYTAGFSKQYVAWEPCPIECMESLEQLRVLWNRKNIHVACALASSPPGVDTEKDLACIREFML